MKLPGLIQINGIDDYATGISLPGKGEWQSVILSLTDFYNAVGKTLADWKLNQNIQPLALAALLLSLAGMRAAETTAARATVRLPQPEDYTLLWWADGPPQIREKSCRRAPRHCVSSRVRGAWPSIRNRCACCGPVTGRHQCPVAKAVQPGRTALAELPSSTGTVRWLSLVTGSRASGIWKPRTSSFSRCASWRVAGSSSAW